MLPPFKFDVSHKAEHVQEEVAHRAWFIETEIMALAAELGRAEVTDFLRQVWEDHLKIEQAPF